MRRKNLTFTIGLILLLALLHAAGVPLARSSLAERIDTDRAEQYFVSGKVTGLEERDNGGCRLEVRVETIDGTPVRKKETVLVNCPKMKEEPGAVFRRKICFQGSFSLPEERRNPGCFDYRLYLKSRGIWYQMAVSDYEIVTGSENPADRLAAWLIGRRFAFRQTLPPESRGLVCGILFGDTGDLDEEVYRQFQASGTAHILAVSGLHLGILYGLYQKIAGRKKKPAAVILLGMAVLAYGTVSMWSPSVQRAAVMIALPVLAQFLDLRYDMSTGLSTVALVLILRNPYVIFGAGFQMSFLAVASICFLCPVIPSRVPEGLSAMVAVQAGLLLYQMYQFNYFSLTALAANLPVVFLTGILVPAALSSFFLFMIVGSGGPLAVLTDSLSHLLLTVNRLTSLDGKAGIDVVSPPLWLVVAIYLMLFFLSSETGHILWLRGKKKIVAAVLLLCVLTAFFCDTLLVSPVSGADLVFVDVGQGDCLHIRDGNRNILIDGGGSVTYNVGENILKPYLLKNQVARVDLAIATHLHTDHFQGLEELSAAYPVKKLVTGLTAGNCIQISEQVSIETLWPLEIDEEAGQEENSQCSVFMIRYGSWRILVTGDLDARGEQEMVDWYSQRGQLDILKADILKVGHHGSGTSTCDGFLDAAEPEMAVIQVGKRNIYGHPDGKVIEKLQQKGIIVRRNDHNGAIGFIFKEKGFQTVTVISSME